MFTVRLLLAGFGKLALSSFAHCLQLDEEQNTNDAETAWDG
jgi:hypothetical protein